ncbi:MAG: tetratricopeptide repeat protein [Vicinamibacterales bacterium]
MRTQLFRAVLAIAVALAVSAPAFAQSIVKGTVVDGQGQPIEGAVIQMQTSDGARKAEAKTNNKGEFLQVGLSSGPWDFTAVKGTLKQTLKLTVRQGANNPLNFQLAPGSGLTEAEKTAQAALGTAAQEGTAAMRAGNHDLAIAKFTEVVAKIPTCSDCYYNMGVSYAQKQAWPEAETAFKKTIELKPDHADAYSALANVYNATKRFDEAVVASAKAAELSGGAAAGGGNAEALYNQGVILWNAQKYAEAKTQFEAAVKADGNMALAYYQLGMANLNLGQLPAAKEAFQGYLKADANGPKAAEVQGILKQLP